MVDIVDIGFAEVIEPWKLESRFFPSKIGGKPAWLDLKHIPDAKHLACDYCENPCIFLCQLYAPYEDDENAFHRTIYVFICKNSECSIENQNGNLKVFRSQLKRENDFYPSDPPEEKENYRTDIDVKKWLKTCDLCGISSTNHCAKCKKTNYCSRAHQVWDWKDNHKISCGNSQCSLAWKKFLFPEYELTTEAENYTEHDKCNDSDNELKKFEEMVRSGEAGSLQSEKDIDEDLLKMACDIEDKTFFHFKKRVEIEPEQVVRYNRGGTPLFISSHFQPDQIPNCEECGGERQFEFQVMPQLLNYLKIDSILESIDWGILAIYTCKKSCTPQSKYIQEYVWKQDILKDQKG